MGEIAHKRKPNAARGGRPNPPAELKRPKVKQTPNTVAPFSLEWRDDAVGHWLIATNAKGEQRVLTLLSRNKIDEEKLADYKAFGIG
jgi:hypothetical protein